MTQGNVKSRAPLHEATTLEMMQIKRRHAGKSFWIDVLF